MLPVYSALKVLDPGNMGGEGATNLQKALEFRAVVHCNNSAALFKVNDALPDLCHVNIHWISSSFLIVLYCHTPNLIPIASKLLAYTPIMKHFALLFSLPDV